MLIFLCQCLREACESALEEKLFLGSCQTDNEATIEHSARLDLLGKVFTKAAEDDTPTEVCSGTCAVPQKVNTKI